MSKVTSSDFQRNGLLTANTGLTAAQFTSLAGEYRKAQQAKRPWHYNQLAGLHNPWGKSARLFDSWALLDICHSDALLELLRPLLGADIILWESAFYGYAAFATGDNWIRHSEFSPVDPMAGISVRIALDPAGLQLDYLPGSHCREEEGDEQINKSSAQTITVEPGAILCHDTRLAHRYIQPATTLPCADYVIHYMPASSLLVRDPSFPAHRLFAEHLPLINYVKSPLWQVCGQDHANNNFVTGFSPPAGQWSNAEG